MEEKIIDTEQELKILNDKYLRLYAEFENYRKRIQKENSERINLYNEKLILEILPIIDNFERSIKFNTDGIELIYNQLKGFLFNNGVSEIDCLGKKFDTDFHEAISTIKKNKYPENHVYKVIQKGYILNGKVIRHSKVIVTI